MGEPCPRNVENVGRRRKMAGEENAKEKDVVNSDRVTNTLLKPKRHSVRCHGFMVHA